MLDDIERRTRQHVAGGEAGGTLGAEASNATAPGEQRGVHPRVRPGPNGEAVGTLTMPCSDRARASLASSKRPKHAGSSEIAVRFVACTAKKVEKATLAPRSDKQEQLSLPAHRCDSADCPVSRGGKHWKRGLKDIQAKMDRDGEIWVGNYPKNKDSPVREYLVRAT